MTNRRSMASVFTLLAFLALLTLTAAACSESSKSAEVPSYLYVFSGRNTELRAVPDRPGTYAAAIDLSCVTIEECAPIAWFTDRPVRDSGTLTPLEFVSLWTAEDPDGFANDAPNVAIELPTSTTGGDPDTVLAEMSEVTLVRNPTRNMTITLTATMTVLPSEPLGQLATSGSHLASHTDTATDAVPTTAGSVTVFVDSLAIAMGAGGNGGSGSALDGPVISPPPASNTTLLVYASTFIPFDSSF